MACACNLAECVELACVFVRHALNAAGVCMCDNVIPASHSRQIGAEGRLHSKNKSVNNINNSKQSAEDGHCC